MKLETLNKSTTWTLYIQSGICFLIDLSDNWRPKTEDVSWSQNEKKGKK